MFTWVSAMVTGTATVLFVLFCIVGGTDDILDLGRNVIRLKLHLLVLNQA